MMTIPQNFSDLYNLSADVLYAIKGIVLNDEVILESPPEVSMFNYDNNLIIIQSFLDHTEPVTLHFKNSVELVHLLSGKKMKATCEKEKTFTVSVRANEYIVLKYNLTK
jgi:hypothetical protein